MLFNSKRLLISALLLLSSNSFAGSLIIGGGVESIKKYPDASMLPVLGNQSGDVAEALDTHALYAYDILTTNWILIASPAAATAVTALIGDVHCTGPGACVSTIQPNVVDNTKLAQIPALSVKGNNTGATTNAVDVLMSALPVSTAQSAADAVVQAFAIQRANHTGTQLAATISDFVSAVATAIGFTPEDVANKSTDTSLGTSDILYPSQKAAKTYIDTAIAGATIPDATTLVKGKLKLAGDLGGTADLPTVPDLANKAPIASPTFTGVVKTTGSIINLNDASYLMEGTDDPTSVAVDAPISSTYRNTVTGIIYTKNDAGLTTNWSSNLTSGIYGSTTIPNGFVASTTPATSASTTFVDVMSTTVVVSQTTVVHAIAAMNLNATTATAIAGIRVQINAVNGQTMLVNLSDTTNKYSTSAQQVSASLTPGTYTVKAQIQRSSGTGTVNFANGTLFTQAQQGIINSTSPSRILYVSKNGGGTGADGSWNKPYSVPSAAVATALLTSDSNNPIAIAIAPGIQSSQYVDSAPVTITRGGISIFSMASPRYKGSQVRYSGTFIVDMSVVPGSFEVYGIDITSPPGAAWDAWPAAIYSTGTSAGSIFIGNAVMNTNAVSRSGIYNDNPNATIYVTNSDVKSGAVGSTNVPPIKITAGTINIFNSNVQDRQDLNLGTCVYSSGGTYNMYGGNCTGKIDKASNTSVVNFFQGTNIQSGSNAAITTQATASTGSVGLFNAILTSTAANAITGNETVYMGQALYAGTAVTLDPNLAISPLTTILGNIAASSLTISNIFKLPVQALLTTPTCATAADDGKVAITSLHILCVCNGSAWNQTDGVTACTF